MSGMATVNDTLALWSRVTVRPICSSGLSSASDWPRISSSQMSPYGWVDTILAYAEASTSRTTPRPSSVVRMKRFEALGLV
jgi:hypothetical protein